MPALRRALPFGLRGRIGGLGIAMPFQLWNWVQYIDAPPGALDAWRDRDIAAELSALCDMPVTVQNDATAACGAELVFGTGERPQDFLYFYIGFFIGGGLVLNGRLFTGRTGQRGGRGADAGAGAGRAGAPADDGGLALDAGRHDGRGGRAFGRAVGKPRALGGERGRAVALDRGRGGGAGGGDAERGDAGRDRHGDDRRLDAAARCGRGWWRRRGPPSGGWTSRA